VPRVFREGRLNVPLKKGSGQKTISHNIEELYQAPKKRPRQQIIAIAESEARKSKEKKK
jgi:hypothetical protein